MATSEPRESYSVQQKDGNVITTTTRTQYEEDVEYSCGAGTIDNRYCCRPEGILRLIEMFVGIVIVCLVVSVFGPGPFKGILFGQTFLVIFTGICICVTFAFLLAFFLRIYASHLFFFPWHLSDLIFSALAAFFFVVLGFVEAYYATGAWSNNCNDIGGDGIIHNGCRTIIEWAFASFFCFVLAILYGVSAFFASKARRYE